MTTAQEQPVSMTEINTVLEDNTFPEKLDWEADFTVRHTCTEPFLPDASIDFAALTPSLTVDSALHRYDNL